MNKIPPHDIKAEQAVLGSLMLENGAADEVFVFLDAGDFYNTAHKTIFKAIMQMITSGGVADIVTVSEKLKDVGMESKTGGAAYVASLVDDIPTAANVLYYAKIVREKAIERKIISEAERIINAVYDPAAASDSKLAEAQKTILNLALTGDNKSLKSSPEIVKKTFSDIEERHSRGGDQVIGHATGLRDLDSILAGLNAGDLIIIAGRPGMGKTSLAVNIAVSVAMDNVPTVIFSLEMPSDALMTRIFAGRTRINSRQIKRGMIFGDQWSALVGAAEEISRVPLFIDDKPDITIQEIQAKCRKLKKENGLGLVVVDYIQLMRITGKHDNREQQVAEISRTLKTIAREIECPVIGLSQLNRQVDGRNDKRPVMSDLRESGAIEQDADVIMFIYRDEVYNKDENNPERGLAEIDVAKQRNGAIGTIKTVFDAKTQTFRDLIK